MDTRSPCTKTVPCRAERGRSKWLAGTKVRSSSLGKNWSLARRPLQLGVFGIRGYPWPMRSLALLLALGLVACGSSSAAPDDAANDSPSAADAPMSDAPGRDTPAIDGSVPQDAIGGDASALDAPAADALEADTSPALCSPESDCGGSCVGESCDTDWLCQTDVACTDDIAAYCGCDGVTFFGSSTCAPRPYQSVGECPSERGANCDRRGISCRAAEPECREGTVAEVTPDGSCWTFDCVAIGECRCTEPAECANTDIYTCRRDMNRCTPFL